MAAVTKDIPARKHYGVAIAWLGMEDPCYPTQGKSILEEMGLRFVGRGTDREVFLYSNSKYGIYIDNRSQHDAVASIIVDGVFQGNFLVPAKDSLTIKRGGMKKESFVFVSHDKEWLKHHSHLPPLTNDEFIGEIIVNVRPLWIRRPQRDTRFKRMLLNQNTSTTAIRPVFGSPNVYRVMENTDPQSSVLQENQEK